MTESSAPGMPTCPVYEQCGGCRTLHLSDTQRTDRFTSRLRSAIGRITWEGDRPQPTIAVPTPDSMLRIRVALGLVGEGSQAGATLPARAGGTVAIETCPATAPAAMAIAMATLAAIRRVDAKGITSILVHLASDHARALVTMVSESSRVYRAQDIAREAIAAGASAVATNQREPARRVLGRRSVPVSGTFPFVDEIDGLRVRVLATTPFDANHDSAARTCRHLVELGEPAGRRMVVVRAGNGLSALALARAGATVATIDDRPEIAHEAHGSYVDSGLAIRPVEGRTTDAVASLSGERIDSVVLEAPRSGTDPDQLAPIVRLIAPARILVVARTFDALAHDLGALGEFGYRGAGLRAHLADPFTGDPVLVARVDRVRN
ncbi:MAG: hypothetical protein U1F36_14310 [Planctomycetota bacterium]